MSERFFVESEITGDSATLVGQEAQHASKVMRVKVGDTITLIDGSGAEFAGRVSRIERSQMEVEVLARTVINRELGFHLTLGVALPKGERQRWLVEKATELGVTRLVPLITLRGVAHPEHSAIVRLRRAVIEASKQCGRNRLLEISEPLRWTDFVATEAGALRILAHPAEESLNALPDRAGRDVVIAVGPEGGFSSDEVSTAVARGWQGVQLGPRILRVETAAVAIAAAITLSD